jgi:tetratricopeptide (TPR) repeat protein
MSQQLYERGLELCRTGNYPAAVEVFSEAISATPYWAELYYRRGLAYYDSGNPYDAVSDYGKAMELDNARAEYPYARAIVRLSLKNIPGAMADVDLSIALQRDYAPAYQLKGILFRKGGQNQQAIAALKQAADLYLSKQDAEGCRRCLEQIKEIAVPNRQPNSPPPPLITPPPIAERYHGKIVTLNEYYSKAIARAEAGDGWQAIKDLSWALKADPDDRDALCCRGSIYSKLDRIPEALKDLSRAIELDDRCVLAYRNRGKIRVQLGDYGGAIADFNFALKIDGKDATVYFARGDSYAALGDYDRAMSDYSEGITLDVDDPTGYLKRAEIHCRKEEIKEAIFDYQQAANTYMTRQDWPNYQKIAANLKDLQHKAPPDKTPSPPVNARRQLLLKLVGGQWAIAETLIDRLRDSYPGMSEDWYIETVICQLERDKEQ